MKSSKTPESGSGMPEDAGPILPKNLRLAWNWHGLGIDDNNLRKFAKHIHWLMECEYDQAWEDAVALLQELVEKARYEHE